MKQVQGYAMLSDYIIVLWFCSICQMALQSLKLRNGEVYAKEKCF